MVVLTINNGKAVIFQSKLLDASNRFLFVAAFPIVQIFEYPNIFDQILDLCGKTLKSRASFHQLIMYANETSTARRFLVSYVI